jgi:hypothetical protein
MATGNSSAAGYRTRFYVMNQYFLKNGTQLPRLHDYLSKAILPVLKDHPGPKIAMQALVAAHMPQVVTILGVESIEQYAHLRNRLLKDDAFGKAVDEWEKGPEAPTEHFTTWLLAATDYSPEIQAPAKPSATGRVFELRTYHAPSAWQLRALHERFAGPEIKIFHRVGVHPLFYSETVFGPMRPNLTYLIPFDNLAEREKAWAKFGADPEWIKVRKESIDRSGQISSVIQMSLFTPADYSPIR